MAQYISVPKIKAALETLKRLGNPYYQFVQVADDFEEQLRSNDVEGFQFLYPEDEILPDDEINIDVPATVSIDGEVPELEEDKADDDLDEAEKMEKEYQEKL